MSVILDYLKKFPVEKAIMTVVLCAICLIAVKVILIIFDKLMKKATIDPLINKILRIFVKAFLLFSALIIVLSSLGISVSSLVATLSIVGVAFSLAIQDFLSNVFGGLQIIFNHPFKVGDYVETAGTAGSVCEVGLFYTKLSTPDKKLVQVPNSKIVTDSIVNYSNAPVRRVEFLVSTSYDNDVENVRSVLLELINSHPLVLKEEERAAVVHVKEFLASDILYTARAWVENSNYWTVYFDIMDSIKPTFEKNGVSFTYPHVNVHMQ